MNQPSHHPTEPLFFRLTRPEEGAALEQLLASEPGIIRHDALMSQLQELMKLRHPGRRLSQEQQRQLAVEHLGGLEPEAYGVWVYYPWSRRLLHLPDEAEFAEIRTNRNQHKITRQEQETLAAKKIGIIGLSVGQSIALTLAMERGFGELRLADFDELELSNLNRIRSGLHNLGLPKVVIAAREIAELDPFLNVRCFAEGITAENMDEFLTGGGRLDLLIDECDGLDIKILARQKARALGMPVLMDTSDRGMIDVERFDLEPGRPLLHGLAGDLDPARLASLSNEEKVPIVLQIAGGLDASVRGKASMVEVTHSIATWPQLASSVMLGGGAATDVARRILLGQFRSSGRYYIDPETLICDPAPAAAAVPANPFGPLERADMEALLARLPQEAPLPAVPAEIIEAIVAAAIAAPSTGNDQPWKWYYRDGRLYLFHDRQRSHSFGDFLHIASYLTFGAVYEHVVLEAHRQGLEVSTRLLPLGPSEPLIAVFALSAAPLAGAEPHVHDELVHFIAQRCTNRNPAPRRELAPSVLEHLSAVTASEPGALMHWLTEPEQLQEAGRIIGACDRLRLLHPEGHYDFVHREMRWRSADAEASRDGIDTKTLGLSAGQRSALEIIRDPRVIDLVRQVGGGGLFEDATMRTVSTASAIGLITMPSVSAQQYIRGGRAYERMWLAATEAGLALHPLISPLYFFPRVLQAEGAGLSPEAVQELHALRRRFLDLFQIRTGLAEVFLCKLAYAAQPEIRALRRPVRDVLYISDTR